MTSEIENSRTPQLSEVLRAAIDDAVGDLYVALPGKVESYNDATQTANVKPLVKRPVVFEDGEEDVESLPVIPDVPIVFPRGGGYFLTFPIARGDNVLLIVCDRAIDNYVFSTGQLDTDPQDLREHDLSDAVAIPGCYPTPKALKSSVGSGAIWGEELGTQIHILDSGVVEVRGNNLVPATSFVALATLVAAELTKIQDALNTHVHSGVTTGDKTSGTSVSGYTPGSVAATKLKSD